MHWVGLVHENVDEKFNTPILYINSYCCLDHMLWVELIIDTSLHTSMRNISFFIAAPNGMRSVKVGSGIGISGTVYSSSSS